MLKRKHKPTSLDFSRLPEQEIKRKYTLIICVSLSLIRGEHFPLISCGLQSLLLDNLEIGRGTHARGLPERLIESGETGET